MARSNHSSETPEIAITIATRTFIRLVLLVVLTILLFATLHKASHALILIFGAFFLSLALNAPVSWLSQRIPGKRRGSRPLATTLSFLIVIALLGAFFAGIVPPLVRQTDSFFHAAPHLVQEFRSQNSPIGQLIRKYHLQSQITKFSQQLSSRLNNVGGAAFSTAESVFSSIFSVVAILVLTFMMLVEGPRWARFTRDIIPKKHRDLADRVSGEMYKVIKGFVNGQVILAVIASVLISPALFVLHISYPIALIVVIFVCGLIPMVGHTIGAVIVTIVALFHSTGSAVAILIYYLLYQQFENYIIQPRIQANTTNMSPLLVFASVIFGVSFGGLFGGLVAIPVAGCIRIALLEYLRTNDIIETPLVRTTINQATSDTK
jgi:predicted PurR-regulated permease PerM